MKPRVVITGIGVVSPNGVGREAFWRATVQGVSGIRRITRFDPSSLPVQIAGEVADFDEGLHIEPRERKHVSRAVPLGLAAISEAVTDAGIEPSSMTRDQLRRIGVLVGSGGGSAEFVDVREMRLDKVVEMIRGKKGTHVRLLVIPADAADPSRRKNVELARDEIKLKDQEARADIIIRKDENGEPIAEEPAWSAATRPKPASLNRSTPRRAPVSSAPSSIGVTGVVMRNPLRVM